jgi:NitT/TauT family transport system substrate-binding protein
MKGLYLRRLWPVLASVALAVGLAACSSSSTGSGTTTSSSNKPELTNITLGVLNDADAIAAQIAIDQGFFKEEGLNVTLKILGTTNLASGMLLAHTLDFTMENDVGMFQQETTVPNLDLQIVADNDQGTPGLNVLMVEKNSPITTLSQLKGVTVGYPALGYNLGSVTTDVLLQPYHLTTKDFKSVQVSFPNDPAELKDGDIDVAYTTEPFVTIMESEGARVLADTLTGPLAGFPVSCWATTKSFTEKYPKTVAAFQAAIEKADQLAATDTPLVRQELPKFVKTMKPTLASVITLPTYNSTLSLARLERVATTMQSVGGLPASFTSADVAAMVYTPSASS